MVVNICAPPGIDETPIQQCTTHSHAKHSGNTLPWVTTGQVIINSFPSIGKHHCFVQQLRGLGQWTRVSGKREASHDASNYPTAAVRVKSLEPIHIINVVWTNSHQEYPLTTHTYRSFLGNNKLSLLVDKGNCLQILVSNCQAKVKSSQEKVKERKT